MSDARNSSSPGAAHTASGEASPPVDIDAAPGTGAAAPEPDASADDAAGPAGEAGPGEARAQEGEVPGDRHDEVPREQAGDGTDLPGALAEARRERDEYLDHLRRERAEFENFRKRSTRERMDALDRGAERLIVDLLGVLDNFGFALGAAAERGDDDPLAKGVRMVHDQLVGVLQQAGLQDVPGVGSVFDPMHHEAMLQVDNDTPLDEPVVVEILRPGYRFKGRVLRPASVKVAR